MPEKKGTWRRGINEEIKKVMNLISHDQIEKSLNDGSTYALVAREAEQKIEVQILGHIKPILEFSKILPQDLPSELPFMRDI